MVQLRKLNGESFWSASSSRLIRYRGEDVIVSHMRDLTAQMAIEDELTAQRELVFQNEKLSAMGELLAGVAHELNNPLSIVVGHAQMLLEDRTDPAGRRHTEQISAAAERCARIVKTFLTMARQQPAKTEVVSINEIARAAAGVARYGEVGNRTQVDCDLAPRLPPIVADPDQITQVVLNLVINAEQAIRASGRGDHIVIRTRLAPAGDAVVLEVEDNGPGIPEEVRGRIFEPFFTTKGVGEGTGIGLALSHRIIHSHKGEIRLDPGFRGGTRFRVTLPATPGAQGAAAAAAPSQVGSGPARILIVDDEAEVAQLNGEILARRGYEVDVTSSVREALEMLRGARYDLVVSDLNMPDLDGRGLYEAIVARVPRARRAHGLRDRRHHGPQLADLPRGGAPAVPGEARLAARALRLRRRPPRRGRLGDLACRQAVRRCAGSGRKRARAMSSATAPGQRPRARRRRAPRAASPAGRRASPRRPPASGRAARGPPR